MSVEDAPWLPVRPLAPGKGRAFSTVRCAGFVQGGPSDGTRRRTWTTTWAGKASVAGEMATSHATRPLGSWIGRAFGVRSQTRRADGPDPSIPGSVRRFRSVSHTSSFLHPLPVEDERKPPILPPSLPPSSTGPGPPFPPPGVPSGLPGIRTEDLSVHVPFVPTLWWLRSLPRAPRFGVAREGEVEGVQLGTCEAVGDEAHKRAWHVQRCKRTQACERAS